MSSFSRSINDAYYTPPEIIEQLVELVGDVEGLTIYDPCCGDGRLSNPFKTKNVVIQSDLPTDYLKFRLGIPVDIIIINPPFTYDKEFIELAVKEAKVVYAILPLNWTQLSKHDNLNVHIQIEFLDFSKSLYFETSKGKRKVKTGIYRLLYTPNICRIRYRKTYDKAALEKLGVIWSKKQIEGSIPLIVKGDVGFTYPEKARHFHPESIVWIKFPPKTGDIEVFGRRVEAFSKFSPTISNLDLTTFCYHLYDANTPYQITLKFLLDLHWQCQCSDDEVLEEWSARLVEEHINSR